MEILVSYLYGDKDKVSLIVCSFSVFVCWDEDLMPSKMSEPALYPAAREPLSFKSISDEDRLQVSL